MGEGCKNRLLSAFSAMLLLVVLARPQSPEADLIRQGNDYSSKGDYARAIQAYTDALRMDPRSAGTFYARGIAYARAHDDNRAIQDFTDAIRLNPDDQEALRARARSYEYKYDYEHAIQDYSTALRLKSADVSLLYERAFSYEQRGDYGFAVKDFSEVIRRFPQAADAYRDRGQAWLFSAHLSEAQQDLRQAVELEPKGPYNLIWLYIARAKKGTGATEELAKHAASLDLSRWPGPVIELFLGKATPEAVLQAASDKDPLKTTQQQCEANFYIAENQALHGQHNAAQQGFRFALENCPKNYFLYVPAARAELETQR